MDINRLTQKAQEALGSAHSKAARYGHQQVDVASVGQRDEPALGVHQAGRVRSGVTSTATRRSSAITRS